MKITPNQLTVLRIILAFISFYFLLQSSFAFRVAAFVIFTLAALTDLWDGWLARSGGMITNFGKILDPIADKILILGAMTCFYYLGLYPFWILIPIFFREILITLLRLYLLSKEVVIAAEKSGKIKVVTQIVSLFITFIYLLDRDYTHNVSHWPDWMHDASMIASYIFLIIATWFTLLSGWEFFKHNWRKFNA